MGLKDAILGVIPGDAARKVSSAMGDGHTTSGLDSAMQAQANKLHPAPTWPSRDHSASNSPAPTPGVVKPGVSSGD